MIILTCQLMFESTGNRLLYSIVYDELTDRFVKVTQRVSAELVQDLNSNNPMIDINDVINLDYVDYVFKEEEIEEIIEMVEESIQEDNEIAQKAKDFITSYRRDKKIKNIIE